MAKAPKLSIDEAVELAKHGLEATMRRVYEKYGDVYFEFERGIRQWPDEEAGLMLYEHTDRTTITIDRPAPDSET